MSNAIKVGAYMATFKERFLLLKIEKDVSFDEIAKNVHVNRSTLSRIVSGKLALKHEMLQALASFFNVDKAYLLGESDTRIHKNIDTDILKFIESAKSKGATLEDVEHALSIVLEWKRKYNR